MARHAMTIGAVALSLSTSASLAQTDGTYLITFDGVVTPQTPTMTVSIWAMWADPQQEFSFGRGTYDLEASEGEFVSGALMIGINPPNKVGVLSGRKVSGADIGQIVLWCCQANLDNPFLLATYEWTTTDFTPRTVNFETGNTTIFEVRDLLLSNATQLYPNQFSPGRAQYFVPAPSALAMFSGGFLVVIRRRRIGSTNDV